ncbi:hypothetical protein [Pedobacter sp. Leaf132]|uniref:hypothetical protein n=1 Tax=Pedobacter sp. Leaf132 TaxID=2876557 RepID=UPI001E566433|nr:hypothetical protein [Pedobacter sp. Leaf132]
MNTNPTQVSILLESFKKNLDLRLEKLKLLTISKASRLVADLITNTLLFVFALLAFFFASLTFGFLISELTSNYVIGFGSLTGFYILIALLVGIFKSRFIEPQLINFTIRKYLRKHYERSAN